MCTVQNRPLLRLQDIKEHYEQKWKRCEKLYDELHKALLEVEQKRRDLSKCVLCSALYTALAPLDLLSPIGQASLIKRLLSADARLKSDS